MRPSEDWAGGWFDARGDAVPALAGESRNARDALVSAIGAELEVLGFLRDAGGDPCWSLQAEEGFFLRAICHFYPRSTFSVRANHPGAGGRHAAEMEIEPRHIVVDRLDDPAWRAELAAAVREVREAAAAVEPPRCPLCDGPMAPREARQGPHAGESFLGCTKFPECRGLRAPWGDSSKDRADDGDDAGFRCPACGGEMRVRYAKRGANAGRRFYGCGGFPQCDRVVDTEEEATALRLMGDTVVPEDGEDEDGGWGSASVGGA